MPILLCGVIFSYIMNIANISETTLLKFKDYNGVKRNTYLVYTRRSYKTWTVINGDEKYVSDFTNKQ